MIKHSNILNNVFNENTDQVKGTHLYNLINLDYKNDVPFTADIPTPR